MRILGHLLTHPGQLFFFLLCMTLALPLLLFLFPIELWRAKSFRQFGENFRAGFDLTCPEKFRSKKP